MTRKQRFALWLLIKAERIFLRAFGWIESSFHDGKWSSGDDYPFRPKWLITTGHAVNAQKQSIYNRRKVVNSRRKDVRPG